MKFRQKFSPRETLALDPRALGQEFDQQEVKETAQQNQVAIVSICGPLEHHHSSFWDSYDSIVERLESAFCDDEVNCVIMCIDSPGGDAAGATEAHRIIQRLKKKYKKPLYAYSNEAMYSAAYSIGSAADEIWVPETGGVGSVGVICALLDKTKQNEKLGLNIKLLTTGARKADSHADRELTDDVVEAMQERVDYLGDVFFRTVAKARSMSPKDVESLEAGVFLGQEAVDSGLADGVAGWYKFLLYVGDQASHELTSQTTSESAKEHDMTIAELRKAKELAAKKLAAAKSTVERTKLFSAYEAATTALADFAAKTKYVKKTEEKLEKDEEDEDDDTDDDDDADEDEEEEEDEESKDEESDEEEEEEKSEEEDGEKSKKSKKAAASMSLQKVEKLFSIVAKLTGKSNVSEIFGALEGMTPRVKNMPKVEQRLAKIEHSSLKTRVKSMLDVAVKDGRVTPAQAKGLESQGMKDHKWLKGYLSAQPKQFRSVDDGGLMPNLDASSPSLDSQGLSSDQKKMITQAAQSAGMSVEDYTKEIAKHTTNKPNGTVSRF